MIGYLTGVGAAEWAGFGLDPSLFLVLFFPRGRSRVRDFTRSDSGEGGREGGRESVC